MKTFCRFCLCFALLQSSLQVVRGQNYTFHLIDLPNNSDSWGSSISIKGTTLVFAVPSYDTYVIDKNGRFSVLKDPYGNSLLGLGINSRGTVVGIGMDPVTGDDVAFTMTRAGEFTTFSVPLGLVTGINDRGDIVGAGSGNSYIRLSGGQIELFRVGDDPNTVAYAVNNRREIAVQVWGATRTESYIRERDGTFLHLEVSGSTDLQVFGINNKGEVSGLIVTNGVHGFIRDRGGKYSFIDVPEAGITYAWGINDRREVSGVAVFSDRTVAFIGTPNKPSHNEITSLLRSPSR